MREKNYYRYWGKAKKTENRDVHECHLLVYHCLDTAAVGSVWFETNQKFAQRTASACALSQKAFAEWFLFILAMHDIGKFSIRFQNLCPDLLEKLQGKTCSDAYFPQHDQMGWEFYDESLSDVLCRSILTDSKQRCVVKEFMSIFARVSFGHHGIPPLHKEPGWLRTFTDTEQWDTADVLNDLAAFFISEQTRQELRFLFQLPRQERNQITTAVKQATWQLAGLVTLCDWIASGDCFSYKSDIVPFDTYWQETCATAKNAVVHTGVIPTPVSSSCGILPLFPNIAHTPSPLQTICNDTPVYAAPQLWVLEDSTGSGKTEAALILASRILAAGAGEGVFVALPTMATSNAMYERMAAVYHLLFKDGERPSLVLSHGSRHLSETFRKSYRDTLLDLPDDLGADETREEEGRAHCAQWLADSSKKALLADCGVGTIDQILLGGLSTRYQSLRVFGMSRKVLIIDEVHAFDAYMSRHLENMLEYHAAIGGSAILLSATLPQNIRQKFAAAFAKGLGRSETVRVENNSFPLVTSVTSEKIHEIPVAAYQKNQRDVAVSFCYSTDEVCRLITESVRAGNCVCWIRNTVADVIEAVSLLNKEEKPEPHTIDIFHSRFCLFDRIAIEKKVLRSFGKDSTHEERAGNIVIASQVVEQSLDLDFDIVISDLAPIDLIMQRAGRLHRHYRDTYGNPVASSVVSDRSSPVFYVHIPPEENNQPTALWFADHFPHARYVYRDTALLWRTKEVLKKEQALRLPDNARFLIESVYGDEPMPVPEVFFKAEDEAWAKDMTKRSIAGSIKLDFSSGYCRSSSNNKWSKDEHVSTRLSEPENTLYLCLWKNGDLVPLRASGEYPWDMSSLRMRKSMLSSVDYTEEIAIRVQNMKKQRRFRYDTVFVVFDNDTLEATGKDEKGNKVTIVYSDTVGLVVNKE